MTDVHVRGFCPRCLLRDSPEGEALAALIREWIDALPLQSRAEEAMLQERLKLCKGCDHLSGGMCGLCGCYVEYRAAQRLQRCPERQRKW